MARKDLPEGLQEMAKDKGTLERDEVHETYEEIFEEVKEVDMERRTLLHAFAGGGGLAVMNALFAQKKYMGDDLESGLLAIADSSDEPFGVTRVDEPPYEVDDETYERYGGPKQQPDTERLFPEIAKWSKAEGGRAIFGSDEYLFDQGVESAGNTFGQDAYGSDPIPAESPELLRAHRAAAKAMGTLNNRYGPFGLKQSLQRQIATEENYLTKREPDVTDPSKLSAMVKQVARWMGSGDTGVGELDKRWIYKAQVYQGNPDSPIRFDTVSKPVINEDEMVVPESMTRTVVGVVEMPLFLNKTSPTSISSGATRLGYGRMGLAATGVAKFLRHLGYNAIPAMNDTGLSVPMSIDAGLGEAGRHGRLIHPEFGSNVRPWKVLTDAPLAVDKYAVFGAEEFCKGCKTCAANCPSSTISYGEQTWDWEGETPAAWAKVNPDSPYAGSKNPGVKKWYSDPASCGRYWHDNGPSCSNCIVTCPFTQGRSWLHDVIRYLAGTNTSADELMANMSSTFGYEHLNMPQEIWDKRYLPFGLSQDPGLGAL